MGNRLEVLKVPFIARDAGIAAGGSGSALGVLADLKGRMAGRKLQVLFVLLAVLLAVDAAVVAFDARQATFDTLYVATVGKLRMLSQRLAKAAQQASQGNREAFKELRDSRDEFASLVKLLTAGGTAASGVDLPPTPVSVRPVLSALEGEWQKTERNAGLVIGEETNLVALGAAVRAINQNNPALLQNAEEVAALSAQTGGSARQNAVTAQLVMLTQRMAKNANTMLAGDVVDPEVAFLLGKDTNTFRDLLQGLLQGNPALHIERVDEAQIRARLADLQGRFKDYQGAVGHILGSLQRLVNAKRASRDIFNDSEKLLGAAERLATGYDGLLDARKLNFAAMGVVSLLAFVVLLLIGKAYIDDSRRRAEDSERQNRENQDAILRLLDEIGNLASGDLTVRAKVTEHMTGAIADSINYTIDELRRLVAGITGAAQHVTTATQEAQTVSTQLLQATQKQAMEIQATGQSVTQMAQSMNQVSASANDSAKVAETSLLAAGKGAQAVQNAIRGMNDIRDQIQETSKRIKRLGESSQEIGEIVQLISDHRADQRARAERRDPGSLRRRGGPGIHGGGGGGAAPRRAVGGSDQAHRRDRQEHSTRHPGCGGGDGAQHPRRGRGNAHRGRGGPGAARDREDFEPAGRAHRLDFEGDAAAGDLGRRGGRQDEDHPRRHPAHDRGHEKDRRLGDQAH
jgi:twitching motility protein PilJ